MKQQRKCSVPCSASAHALRGPNGGWLSICPQQRRCGTGEDQSQAIPSCWKLLLHIYIIIKSLYVACIKLLLSLLGSSQRCKGLMGKPQVEGIESKYIKLFNESINILRVVHVQLDCALVHPF